MAKKFQNLMNYLKNKQLRSLKFFNKQFFFQYFRTLRYNWFRFIIEGLKEVDDSKNAGSTTRVTVQTLGTITIFWTLKSIYPGLF